MEMVAVAMERQEEMASAEAVMAGGTLALEALTAAALSVAAPTAMEVRATEMLEGGMTDMAVALQAAEGGELAEEEMDAEGTAEVAKARAPTAEGVMEVAGQAEVETEAAAMAAAAMATAAAVVEAMVGVEAVEQAAAAKASALSAAEGTD